MKKASTSEESLPTFQTLGFSGRRSAEQRGEHEQAMRTAGVPCDAEVHVAVFRRSLRQPLVHIPGALMCW
jgi:hypothetical protein